MKKKIAMAFLLATLAATPVYAAEVQDFGTAGNVSVQQEPNDNGGSDDWIVVSPGESGRGVKIVDENGKALRSALLPQITLYRLAQTKQRPCTPVLLLE